MKVNSESLCKLQSSTLLYEVQVRGATCFTNDLRDKFDVILTVHRR